MSQGEPVTSFVRAARVLGVEADCGPDALQKAFRAAVKRAHPDRPGGDAARLRAVIEAHELLRGRRETSPAPSPAILTITPGEALAGLRRPLPAADGTIRFARLPAGLRAGDRVRLGAEILTIAIKSQAGLSVIGDHLCLSIEVEPALMRQGGEVGVQTPAGSRALRVTRQDAIRGLARVAGAGLPARGSRPQGDLLVWLKPMDLPQAGETSAQVKLRRFAAAWAA
ncbi:molecular chaperone DnaJ [Phenylobacterium montanum]|uniref:Molecular chaperone DnaJ n=1 Tax=Phenylobacterium montanum TaxID=2823693 RepID=A0A975FXI6_9CAUL|nr:molecular chaperone DnaJ [Caulobacter sp. S6]QUD87115.1 molecular chaperone DnaJ [Caulobacter sp. S6]